MMAAPKQPQDSAWYLDALLEGWAASPVPAMPIVGIADHSGKVRPGDLYLACRGATSHGADHIAQAIRYGARAIAYEPPYDFPAQILSQLPVISVPELSRKLGLIADRFYNEPSAALKVVGVTGTNGKTSTSHFIAHGLSKGSALACGLIGTLGYGLYGQLKPARHTTPQPLKLQRTLAKLRDCGAKSVAMEVSSHGLSQGRTAGVRFTTAVFTNLTRDHLDYHGDMANYAKAKQQLFEVSGLQNAVVNLADAVAPQMLTAARHARQRLGFQLIRGGKSTKTPPGVFALTGELRSMSAQGMTLKIESDFGAATMVTSLYGAFNAENLLAALGVFLLDGIALDDAVARLATLRALPGRMEIFRGPHAAATVVVDYAHTPDALVKALASLSDHCEGDLWCVFGCGGNRDVGKRPEMGAIAEQFANHVVLTDDNPRSEDHAVIISQILAGMHAPHGCQVIHDRGQAIDYAIRNAHEDDIVLVAGKGHEDYQEIGGQRRSFSDRHYVAALLGLEELPI